MQNKSPPILNARLTRASANEWARPAGRPGDQESVLVLRVRCRAYGSTECVDYCIVGPVCLVLLKITLGLILRWRSDRQLRRWLFLTPQEIRGHGSPTHGYVDPAPCRGGNEALQPYGDTESMGCLCLGQATSVPGVSSGRRVFPVFLECFGAKQRAEGSAKSCHCVVILTIAGWV